MWESPGLQTPPLPCLYPQLLLLTKVEVATLILGLEEAPSGLGVHISSLGHQQLHIVLAAPFNGNVQGRLAWGRRQPGLLRGPESATGCGKWPRDLKAKAWKVVHRVDIGFGVYDSQSLLYLGADF